MNFPKTWEEIKPYINIKNILITLSLGLIIFLLCQNSYLRKNYTNNIKVVTDSLTTYKNKVGELYTAQTTYIASEKELKKINNDLYDEIKHLKENPLVVTKVEYITKIDTITIKDIPIEEHENNYSYNWNYKDDWFSIDGLSSFNMETKLGITNINNLFTKTSLVLDVIENKDKGLDIIVKSNNPYCTVSSIEGAVISPEKIKSLNSYMKNRNRWGIGIQAGAGIGLYNQSIVMVPYLGFGISYNIITF